MHSTWSFHPRRAMHHVSHSSVISHTWWGRFWSGSRLLGHLVQYRYPWGWWQGCWACCLWRVRGHRQRAQGYYHISRCRGRGWVDGRRIGGSWRFWWVTSPFQFSSLMLCWWCRAKVPGALSSKHATRSTTRSMPRRRLDWRLLLGAEVTWRFLECGDIAR